MKIKIFALAALLALLFACGAQEPQTTETTTQATTTQSTTTETTTTETTTETTTTSTTAAPTTQKQTTSKPTTQVATTKLVGLTRPNPEVESILNNGNLSEEEKAAALSLLIFEPDKNGTWHIEADRDNWLMQHPSLLVFGSDSPPIQLVYGTVRVKFQYDDQNWLIQMWKGRYGLVMLGGEIGVLKKPAVPLSKYYTPVLPSEELTMSMKVYQHNFLRNETKYLFTRQTETTWWYNGFMPGSFYEYNNKKEIIMVGAITFPDQEMLRAFEASFAEIGFKKGTPDQKHPETYAVSGNTLTFSWQYIDQDAW